MKRASTFSAPAAGDGLPTLPREVSNGIYWIGGCSKTISNEEILHSHASCFLVFGSEASILIDAGMSRDWPAVEKQLIKALDGRKIDYFLPTHPEIPHMGNLGPLLNMFPEAKLVGDLRNYHLYFPEHADRLITMKPGDELDIGERKIVILQAIVCDLPNTLWAYDTREHVLFASDAYCFTHEHHRAGECALMSNELEYTLDILHTRHVLERGLAFTRYVDPEEYCNALDRLFDAYKIKLVAAAHGAVITNPREVTDVFKRGLRAVRQSFVESLQNQQAAGR